MPRPSPSALLLALLLAAALVHASWILLGAQPVALRPLLGNLVFFPLCFLSAALHFRFSRRLSGRPRRAWALFGFGQIAWGIGQVAYTVLTLRGVSTFPSVADVGYLGLIPCFAAGVLLLARPASNRLQALGFALDVAVTLLAVGDVLWHTHLQRALLDYAGRPFALGVALAYPALDLLLVALLLSVVVWRSRGVGAAQVALLGGGLAALFGADILYSFQSVQGIYRLAGPLDLFWVAAFTAFGAAAAVGELRPARPDAPATPLQQDLSAFFPPAVILLAFAAFFLAHGPLHPTALDPGVGAISLLVFARQLVSVFDNRRLNRDLKRQAEHDPLTGALSRHTLAAMLDERVRAAQGADEVVGVMFVDLDRMKHINDAYGHLVGDQVLRQIAVRFRSCLRDPDTVARFGGDEFVLAITVRDRAQVASVAQRVLAAVSRPVLVEGHVLHVTASVGVAVCPEDARDAEGALRHADLAVYQAKAAGKNTIRFFEDRQLEAQERRAALETHLRDALRRDELELHYQPIVDLHGTARVGFEALLRWDSPALGRVSPLAIVQTAEECGLMPELGEWVLDRAVRRAAQWRRDRGADFYVSVNVSATQFALADFVEQVVDALDAHGLPGEALMLEVTENTLITDLRASVARMEALKALGVRIALDDFGTGYSSLGYLMQLPVDVLKVDRSFLHTFAEGGEHFVEAIVTLAHRRGAAVVAEGVEEAWQAQILRRLRCDLAQGYFFARPLPPAEAERFVVAGSEEKVAAD